MAEFLASPLAQVVFLLALTAILIVVGVYVINKVRSGIHEQTPGSSEYLTEFRELYVRGELDEHEYKTIKASLATRLQKELGDNDSEKMRGAHSATGNDRRRRAKLTR